MWTLQTTDHVVGNWRLRLEQHLCRDFQCFVDHVEPGRVVRGCVQDDEATLDVVQELIPSQHKPKAAFVAIFTF